ncbi:PIN domain-containing protein [Candidatus Electronema sp. PJ]|uniref:PIN domain-containing protein n=1 Tax=Candidatus Electronema sp. PJ TaxID=3401572 RepID=UPI003AA8517A
MILVDANIVLRYLLDDHHELSPKAAAIIEKRDAVLPMEVACEVVYVLEKVYKVDRQQIQRHLSELISRHLVIVEKADVLLKALECYGSTTFDFVDTLLWAYHVVEQQEVLTFDAKLRKHIERYDCL